MKKLSNKEADKSLLNFMMGLPHKEMSNEQAEQALERYLQTNSKSNNVKQSGIGYSGLLTCTIKVKPEEFKLIKFTGARVKKYNRRKGILVLERENAFVNIGLNNALDRLFGLASPTVPTHIGLSSDNTAVTAASTTLGGTVSIKVFSPAASRTLQTVTAGATFTQADVAFVIRKVGLLNTSTDAGTGLYDVIGGAGVAPYNQAFTIDLTSSTSFSLLMQIAVTAAAS